MIKSDYLNHANSQEFMQQSYYSSIIMANKECNNIYKHYILMYLVQYIIVSTEISVESMDLDFILMKT